MRPRRYPRGTGAKHRLNREFGHAYAAEELVAKLGAAFLCADLQISNEPRLDHTAYLSQWLRLLNVNRRSHFRSPETPLQLPVTSEPPVTSDGETPARGVSQPFST